MRVKQIRKGEREQTKRGKVREGPRSEKDRTNDSEEHESSYSKSSLLFSIFGFHFVGETIADETNLFGNFFHVTHYALQHLLTYY